MSDPDGVTSLLQHAHCSESAARDLIPLVYGELHRLAQRHMRAERAGHTLQPTALVHEAYLQLVNGGGGPWRDRTHFFATAAGIVRRILVEHARSRSSRKRGGGWQRVPLEPLEQGFAPADERVLLVDEVLRRLADVDPEKARLVELRFFGGLTNREVAAALGISLRSVVRSWAFARAWLTDALRGEDHDAH